MVAVLAATGCRDPGTSPTFPVGGKVLHRGQPLSEVTVTLTPKKGRPAVGTTDSQGRFKLSTYRPNDGAVPGRHTVTVTPVLREPPPVSGTPQGAQDETIPYPARYCQLGTSDLEVDIQPRHVNSLTLELKDR